jgi:membrane protein
VHTEPVSTVLPSGSSASTGGAGDDRTGRGAVGDGARTDGAARDDVRPGTDAVPLEDAQPEDAGHGSTAAPRPGRLSRWPAPLRVPLEVLGAALAKAWRDRVLGLSAEAAFWQILSVPPLLIGLLGSLGYLDAFIGDTAVREIEDRLLSASAQVLTDDVVDSLVAPTLSDILESGQFQLVSVGFVLSLWAGSSATATFMNTIVIAYDQRDVRGPVRTRLKALWLFVVGMVLAVLMLPLLVVGRESLIALLPDSWEATGATLINQVYWPLVLVGLFLALTTFYHVVLADRLPWRRHLPGAAFAVVLFLVAAIALRTYVSDILTAALPYGALATPIAALMFCFLFGLSVLLGAEVNTTIQQRWPAPLLRHGQRRVRRRHAKLQHEARRLGVDR